MYIFISVNMYATRRCTHGVPTVYPYPQYPWLTQPEGRRVRVLTGIGRGQPGITRGLPVLIPTDLLAIKEATDDRPIINGSRIHGRKPCNPTDNLAAIFHCRTRHPLFQTHYSQCR